MAPPPAGRVLRTIAARTGLVLAGVLVAALLAEGGLVLLGVSAPTIYRWDGRLGWSLRPGAEAAGTHRAEPTIRINSGGMRDEEHPVRKPAGTIRIAVLGDSFTEATQVRAADAFWSVLERELASCRAAKGRRVEALNFGVGGYGTDQELLTLRYRGWTYAPDVVLLVFATVNDLTDNVNTGKPHFVLRDGRAVLDESWLRAGSWLARLKDALARHSRLVKVLDDARERLFEGGGAAEAGEPGAAGAELGVDPAVYRPPSDDRMRGAWEVTEAVLAEANREIRSRRASLVLGVASSGIQVHPDPAARAAFMRRNGIDDLYYQEGRLSRLGEREGFRVVPVAPDAVRAAERTRTFFHGFPGGGAEGPGLGGTGTATGSPARRSPGPCARRSRKAVPSRDRGIGYLG